MFTAWKDTYIKASIWIPTNMPNVPKVEDGEKMHSGREKHDIYELQSAQLIVGLNRQFSET